MSNWDDQFDFDDLDDKKKNNKNSNKPKVNKNNDDDLDFFDDQDKKNKKKQPQSTLPTINSRNSAKIKSQKEQTTSKTNPYANKNFGTKQTSKNDYDYEFQEQIDEQPVSNKKQVSKNKINSQKQVISLNNKKSPTNQMNKSNITEQYNDQYVEEEFQQPLNQSVKQSPSIKNIAANNKNKQKAQQKNPFQDKFSKNTKPIIVNTKQNKPLLNTKQKQPENQYDDQFQNDQYGNDDFQEEVKSPVKKINTSSNKKPALQLKSYQTAKNTNSVGNQTLKNNNNSEKNNKLKQAENRSKSVVPPKIPVDPRSNKGPVLSNKNINKIQSHSVNKKLVRSSSKKSIRSNDQKSIKGSRVTQKNQSQYFPNKHTDMVQRSFPHDESRLNALTQVEINKINEKMRAMIRKFNDELNDLINKNMIMLKNKVGQKQFSIEERIRQLQIQKKSGQTAIQVMEKDFDKLQGREGELKEQEYQLILQKQIQQKKNQIKQAMKQITVLKRSVDNKGKKLSVKQQQQKNAQNIHHLKTFLIQLKKDQQRSDQRISKLQSNHQQLQTKIADMDYKLQDLISQAKQKGINIQSNAQLQKKYEQLKIKLQNVKSFNKKTQGLISTKTDIVNHQNQQIRITIRNINSQINNFYGSIDHSLNESIKLIQKAKEKANINPLFAQSLDKLLKQIQQSKSSNEYIQARSQVKSRRSDSARNQKSKKQVQQQIQKSLPLRTNNSQNNIVQPQQPVMIKPKFTKNKVNQDGKLNIQNKNINNQRIWKQEQQRKARINDENNLKINDNNNRKTQENNLIIIEQQKKDKSKPFSLKKNKQKNSQKNDTNNSNEYSFLSQKSQKNLQPSQQNTPVTISKNIQIKEEPKNQQVTGPTLGPRMMRFGRKKNNQEIPSNNNIYLSQPAQNALKINVQVKKEQGLKLQIQPSQKQKQKTQNQQKPIFVPKRFNLRNKAQKKDDSYTPSIQSVQKVQSPKQQAKIEIKAKQPSKQEYKPKFDFKSQQFKIQEKQSHKKQPQKSSLTIDQPEVKPRFNLRLRDRKKPEQEIGGGYGPTINNTSTTNSNLPKNQVNQFKINPTKNEVKPTEQKVLNPYAPKNQTIIQKKEPVNNPYAPSNNPYAPSNNQSNTTPINNPYAPKVNNQKDSITIQAPKRQRGPLKKQKITSQNIPKQKFNIYDQAQDLTQAVKTIGGGEKQSNLNLNLANDKKQISISRQPQKKKQQLNLNDLLGLKKQTKKNDFHDLLGGDIGPVNTKNKKKNNDFFGDLEF